MLSLIASFCSIKAPIFAGVFYPYFIHISPCFSGGFPIRLSVRLYSLDYHGRPAKPKARIGGRLFPSCRLELVRLGIYQRVAISLIIRASAVFGPSRGGGGGGGILCSYEVSTISKYNGHCISYNLIG